MRLIDADALAKEMENAKYVSNTSAYAKGCNDVINYCIRRIKEQPTIDQVRHARWVHYPDNNSHVVEVDMCSECEDEYVFGDIYNYCPNCGAKMDGAT